MCEPVYFNTSFSPNLFQYLALFSPKKRLLHAYFTITHMPLHVDLDTYPPTYYLTMGARDVLFDVMRRAIEYFTIG